MKIFILPFLLSITAWGSETAKPSTCYVSSTDGIGLVACLDAKGEPTSMKSVSVEAQSDTNAETPSEIKLSISGITSPDEANGVYALKIGDNEKLEVTVQTIDPDLALGTSVYYRRGGGGAYRRGGAVAYRGRGVAVRRGGYYRGGAVVGGALVGGAVGAAAAGAGCDPNYNDCSGYYPGAAAAGAVVGGAVAAGAYRRGGAAYYRRGGAVAVRRGGAHVSHYRGGGRRR